MALGPPRFFSPRLKPALLEGFLDQPFCPHWPKSAQATSTSAIKAHLNILLLTYLNPVLAQTHWKWEKPHSKESRSNPKQVVNGESLAHVSSKPMWSPGLEPCPWALSPATNQLDDQ